MKCEWSSSDAPDGALYSEALNVICMWLRSWLSTLSQSPATLSGTLDILVQNFQNQYFKGFYPFIALDSDSFGFFCRLFPEMDRVEVCACIVEKYLSLSIE